MLSKKYARKICKNIRYECAYEYKNKEHYSAVSEVSHKNKRGHRRDYVNGTVAPLNIPKCNCVYYELSGGSFVCVRPSGTEPKLKIYYSIKSASEAQAEEDLAELQAAVAEMLEKAKN